MTEHVLDDDLVALALDVVEPDERARLSAHLTTCESCRTEYALVEDTVHRAMVAAPAIAPPPGFSGRALAAMGVGPAAVGSTPGAGPVPVSAAPGWAPERARVVRAPRRWWTPLVAGAAAAALVLGLGLGVAGTLALTARLSRPVGSVPGGLTAAAALVTGTGELVGTAGLTTMAGRDYLVVTVARGRPGVAYECVTVDSRGQRTSVGTWTLDGRYGGTDASGMWVVAAPPGGVKHVELLAPSGSVWSRAQL